MDQERVQVIERREFLNDKDAGRNASEPGSSLVNEMRLPTSCLYREGRSVSVQVMEATLIGVGRAFAKQKLAKPHTRFDEGGQARACSLLYLELRNFPLQTIIPALFEQKYRGAQRAWMRCNAFGYRAH
ncbi:MAG: hypothetical protein Q8K59_07620 [Nitrosomonas sp.]|nr:hypothetical protein [Nitrosomonas sp.]MDP1950946.1 hypothetical protein [Nitrosomonas sp.]